MKYFYRVKTAEPHPVPGMHAREPLTETEFDSATGGRPPDCKANASELINSGGKYSDVERITFREAENHFPAGRTSVWSVDEETGAVQGWLVDPPPTP